MTSVGYNFLCGHPHGAIPHPQASSLAWPTPPSCGCHKWMAPYMIDVSKISTDIL